MAAASTAARNAIPKEGSPPISYIDVYRATALDRIEMVKAGVQAAEAKRIISDLTFAQGMAFTALKLSAATVNRKAAQNQVLTSDESERVIGVAKLIGQVLTMVEASGTVEGFDAAAWISRWLTDALPALGGRRPIDFLDTMEGQTLVGNVLAQTQSGAYA